MLKSMTGFGKAVLELGNKKVTIEIKSLNSKQLDIFTRIPNLYKEKDIEIRNLLKSELNRGKIELSLFVESVGSEKEVNINIPIVKEYYRQLSQASNEIGINTDNEQLLQTIMRLPETLKIEYEELDEKEWLSIAAGIKQALLDIQAFRVQEGTALKKDIYARIDNITDLSSQVPQFEKQRIETVKTRLRDKLHELSEKQNIDENRFEQELIYFLEKLDITEEKVRLANHCKYFLETAKNESNAGKKLGFIAQEIGREINTLGSKANESNIQKLVIQMKDELEKIKEQILNVL